MVRRTRKFSWKRGDVSEEWKRRSRRCRMRRTSPCNARIVKSFAWFSFGGILCSFRTFSALNAMNGRFTFAALSGGGEEGARGGGGGGGTGR